MIEETVPFDADGGPDGRSHPHSRVEPLLLLPYEEMIKLPEPEWLVQGVLQKRTAALIFGGSNTFKSFVGIDLLCSVSTGLPWHGQFVAKGKALYVATEGGNAVGRRRIPAWYDFHHIKVESRTAFLYPDEICLDKPGDVAALIAAARHHGPFSLIVLDIFGGTVAGSESEHSTARAWVNGMQRILHDTGATVLAIAHTGWSDGHRARMHTHFWGSFDTRVLIQGNSKKMTTIVSVERHKDADSVGIWRFKLTASHRSLVPVLEHAAPDATATKAVSRANQAALGALDVALRDHGQISSDGSIPSSRTVSIDTWRAVFNETEMSKKATPEARKKAFSRARISLQEEGLIECRDGFVWKCVEQ